MIIPGYDTPFDPVEFEEVWAEVCIVCDCIVEMCNYSEGHERSYKEMWCVECPRCLNLYLTEKDCSEHYNTCTDADEVDL